MLYASAAVLIPVGLGLVFHDALARWVALRLVQQVPGVEAQFDGPFDVTHTFPLTLDAAAVSLAFTGDTLGGTRAHLDSLHLEILLWPLLRGIVHIERLDIADADIDIPPARAASTPEQSPSAVRIPVIEQLRLERVHVRFQREADAPPHELTIAHLQIGAGEGGTLTATAAASLDGDGLELTAKFGSVEQMLRRTAPFPIEATVRAPSWDLVAHISGTLAEPLSGHGAQFDVRATISDMSALRDVFLPDAPLAGSIDAKAHLSGDLFAPALSDVSLAIEDEDRFRFKLSGSIADLQGPKGLDLEVDAASQDPAVSQYLTRATMPAVQTIRFQAAVRGNADAYHLEDLNLALSGKNDLSVSARGAVQLTELESTWPMGETQLDVHLSASVADLATWLPQDVPKTGTLRLQAQLEGSAESLALNDLELELDSTQPLGGKINGELAYTVAQLEALRTRSKPGAALSIPADLDVMVDLATADSRSLSTLLGQALPDLGALSAKAHLRRDGDTIRITELAARTNGKRSLRLSIDGLLTLTGITAEPSVTEADLRLTGDAPNAKSVASLVGPLPIDPGPWRIEAQIRGKTGALRAEAIKFDSGKDDTVRLRVEGSISDLERLISSAGKTPTGVRLKGHVAAVSTKQLGALIHKPLPNLGRFDARFDARGDKATWSVPKATITITHAAGFGLEANGKASDLLNDPRFDAKLALQAPNPQHIAARMGVSLPLLPAITADGYVQGSQKEARFSGRIDAGTMSFETDLDAQFTSPRPYLSGTLSTPVIRLNDFLSPTVSSNASLDKPAASGTTTAEARAKWDRLLSDQPLGFEHLNHADIDLTLIAEKVEGERILTEPIELTVEVANGRLKAHHKKFRLGDKLKHGDGPISTALDVDSATDPPRVSFQARGDNISLGALYAQVSAQPRLTEGLFSFHVDLTGSGQSPHALVSTANGNYGHVLENTKLAGGDLDDLNLGLLRLIMAAAVSSDHTDIDCFISKFRVNDGVAAAETAFLTTPKMVAAGTRHMNFSDETLDIIINTESERMLFKKKAILRVHGPMRKPEIAADLSETAVTAGLEAAAIGATMVALPELGFAMAALDTLGEFVTDGEQQPCVSGATSER